VPRRPIALRAPLLRVAFSVASVDAEIARAWLLERFPEGFEERDRAGMTELAVYTDAVGEAAIRSAFDDVRAGPVEGGWEDRWREFHRPMRAGGLWIGPPWTSPPAGTEGIVVDPGRAFGTGAHPTTRACIELLAGMERGSLLDAGCGSGVVAVAALKLGFAPVIAVDVDPVAVAVASGTVRDNSVEVGVRRLDVLHDELPETDVVVANIELAAVEALLARVPARLAVTSGYFVGQAPNVAGWHVVRTLDLDRWAADVLEAK
jgi:ribosomal protein L11 methyltransferase